MQGLVLNPIASAGQNIEEEIYLHVSSSNVIAGESLFFSAYVYSKKTHKPSHLSKILYIELLDDKGEVIEQSKIELKNGRGYGDFFISSMYATKTYQLIAYTRWMKNFDSFYRVPIQIINPFEEYTKEQSAVKELGIEFYCPSAGIVLNQNNTVSFRIVNAPKSARFKGKVVDENGTKLIDFTPKGYGMGSFSFLPKSASNHQVILEDNEGQFFFFELPQISNEGSFLSFSENKAAMVLTVNSTQEDFLGELIIKHKTKGVERIPVVNGFSKTFVKDTPFGGLFEIGLMNYEGELIDKRLFYYPEKSNELNINTEQSYSTRSSVQIDDQFPNGEYSISVRKKRGVMMNYLVQSKEYTELYYALSDYYKLPLSLIDELKKDPRVLNILLNTLQNNSNFEPKDQVKYLPDFRGELIEGLAKYKNGVPAKNKQIMYSTLGINMTSIADTDDEGRFIINTQPVNEDKIAFMSLLDTGKYEISIKHNYLKNKPTLEVKKIQLDSITLKEIVESSVRMQVENAYYDFKKDSSYQAIQNMPVITNYDYFYNLDQYNRFPSIRETFIEYIPSIAVKQKKGDPYISVRSGEYKPSFNESPLILLDGVPIDIPSLYQFSPYKIQSIGVVGKRYYLGSKIFDGVVSLHSVDGDMHDFKVNENMHQFTYKGIQPFKKYYQPDYSSQKFDRIPDQREQLLWHPNIIIDSNELNCLFYTSDVPGLYEISIEGFTSEGQPVSVLESFQVKETTSLPK